MFGKGTTVQQSQQPQGQEPQPGTTIESVKGLTAEANRIYEEGQNRLRAGDWAGYGESNKKLKETLDELSRRAAE